LHELQYREDYFVHGDPFFLPEKREESLNLTQGNNLSKQSHDPILTDIENMYALLLEFFGNIGKLFRQHIFQYFTMVVESRQLDHMYFL
jgi:hypothetical protein